MSIIKSIKQVLGLGPAAENHFWDGSVANQLSLKRGTPDAPGSTVFSASAGVPMFPVLGSFADDAAAAAGGVPVGGLYRTASAVKVRVA